MEELEPYEQKLAPYRVYFTIIEFVGVPILAILAGYMLGNGAFGVPVAIGYLGARILLRITRRKAH